MTATATDSRRASADDVRFSNSLTTEVNILAPGNIGHIVRNRTFDSTYPFVPTDKWFHYDQVGTVLCSTDASGALISQIQQDTFGNTQSSWSTGQWGGTKAGWHHNTKEYDGDVDLVPMGVRWYLPETGTFVSKAPYPPAVEDPYTIVENDPLDFTDPAGMLASAGKISGGTPKQREYVGIALQRSCDKLNSCEAKPVTRSMRRCLKSICNGNNNNPDIKIGGFWCSSTKAGYTGKFARKGQIHICPWVADLDNPNDPEVGPRSPDKFIDHTLFHEFAHSCGDRGESLSDQPEKIGFWMER